MIDNTTLPHRIGVGIILLNDENKVFVGKRIDNQEGNYWQMPQGGIDKNEDLLQAAKRELEEETGVKTVKIRKTSKIYLNKLICPIFSLIKVKNVKY